MITGILTESEYIGAHALHRRPAAIAINVVLGAIVVAGLVLAVLGIKPWGFVLIAGGACGLIGEAIQAHLYLPRKVRSLYSQFKGIDSPITYRWDAEKFSVQSDRGGGERNWSDLLKVKENDSLLLLYTTDALFEIVPKRWFESPAQLSEFERLAKGKRET